MVRPMYLAWTTVGSSDDADRLAQDVVERGLAACVQIEAIVSHYRWEGKHERANEYRLTFKCLPAQLQALRAHVLGHHPYDTPEWLALAATDVAEKYLSWAKANSSTPPL